MFIWFLGNVWSFPNHLKKEESQQKHTVGYYVIPMLVLITAKTHGGLLCDNNAGFNHGKNTRWVIMW